MIASTQTNHPLPGTIKGVSTRDGTSLEVMLQLIRDAGFRITQPRIAILRALLRQKIPVSIEHLHQELKKNGCDLVTVYRCLDAFEQIGLVRHCYFHNGTALFELVRSDRPGYYVIGRDSGTVHALDDDLAQRLQDTLREVASSLQARGYHTVRTSVEIMVEAEPIATPGASRANGEPPLVAGQESPQGGIDPLRIGLAP